MPVYVAVGERKAWISDPDSVGDVLSRRQPELSAVMVPKAGQVSFLTKPQFNSRTEPSNFHFMRIGREKLLTPCVVYGSIQIRTMLL